MKNRINRFLRIFGSEIHGLGYLQKLKNTEFKKSEWTALNELLKNEVNVIFDIGAHRGNTVTDFVNTYPNSSVHSFEPFPESCEFFIRKHGENKKVQLNQYALAAVKGKTLLNINKSVDTNSLLNSKKINASSDKSCVTVDRIEVETDTLDNYCSKNSINSIDILKMDVQGSEIEVLKGAFKMLSENRIKVIFSETYFQQQYESQPLFHDISKFLYTYGFVLQDFYDPYYSANSILWCDSMFVSKSIL